MEHKLGLEIALEYWCKKYANGMHTFAYDNVVEKEDSMFSNPKSPYMSRYFIHRVATNEDISEKTRTQLLMFVRSLRNFIYELNDLSYEASDGYYMEGALQTLSCKELVDLIVGHILRPGNYLLYKRILKHAEELYTAIEYLNLNKNLGYPEERVVEELIARYIPEQYRPENLRTFLEILLLTDAE